MYRRRVTFTALTGFAIGAAFAAQPTSVQADWARATTQQRSTWVPGTDIPMSVFEPGVRVLAPPQ
jgi:hypothetical protein